MNKTKNVFISGKGKIVTYINMDAGFAPRYDDKYLEEMSKSAWGIIKDNKESTNAAKEVAKYYKDLAKLYKDSTLQLNANDPKTLKFCSNNMVQAPYDEWHISWNSNSIRIVPFMREINGNNKVWYNGQYVNETVRDDLMCKEESEAKAQNASLLREYRNALYEIKKYKQEYINAKNAYEEKYKQIREKI